MPMPKENAKETVGCSKHVGIIKERNPLHWTTDGAGQVDFRSGLDNNCDRHVGYCSLSRLTKLFRIFIICLSSSMHDPNLQYLVTIYHISWLYDDSLFVWYCIMHETKRPCNYHPDVSHPWLRDHSCPFLRTMTSVPAIRNKDAPQTVYKMPGITTRCMSAATIEPTPAVIYRTKLLQAKKSPFSLSFVGTLLPSTTCLSLTHFCYGSSRPSMLTR